VILNVMLNEYTKSPFPTYPAQILAEGASVRSDSTVRLQRANDAYSSAASGVRLGGPCSVRRRRDFLIVILPCAFAYICGIVGSKWPEDRPYVYSYARLVSQLTYDLHRISGLSGAISLIIVDMASATEGP
jgi:hypothetical protein